MKTGTKYISLAGIFLIVLLTASILADSAATSPIHSATKTASTTELQRFYDIAKSEVDFYSNVANSMVASVPSDTLTADLTKLQNDLTQIQTYVTAADRTSLQQFVQSTFQPDMKTTNQDILSWRQANFKNLSVSARTSLKNGFTQSRSDFQASRLTAYKNFANGRIDYFNNVITQYQNRINNLQSKGLDVSALTQLLSDAQTQIITPLQTAISSATDPNSLNQAVKQYAIFDGAQNGTNFHLAAKFNVDELQIALTKLTSTTGVSQTSITQLQTDITTANSVLTAVGINQYSSTQQSQLWNALKDGWNTVKSATSTLSQVNSATNTG